jgi:HAE1 family hydrophobic/amphiphilic exporter-1
VTLAGEKKDMGGMIAKVKAALEKLPWPADFNYKIAGQAEDFKESFLYLAIAMLAAILLVYMVMASQFESLLHPFIILLTIPLASVGVVLALVITKTTLSVSALIGVLVLVGVVVNNAIVLIDTINKTRRKKAEHDPMKEPSPRDEERRSVDEIAQHAAAEERSLLESVKEAGARRLRPILMTASTTVLGMTPLAMEFGDGSETWSPMARAVIGGLITSTLLTLVVMPTVYTSLETYRIRRRRRKAQRRARRAARRLALQE